LVTEWLVLRTALLFVRSAVRLVSAELPEPVAVCSPKQALCERADVSKKTASVTRGSPSRNAHPPARVLGEGTYESLAHKGETMTTAEMATYAYDQIDQARTTLEHPG
jgi:hypothetical protein